MIKFITYNLLGLIINTDLFSKEYFNDLQNLFSHFYLYLMI